MRPLIIDVEASGFGRGSYPIEVGVALADGQSQCSIIRRETDWQHWDPKAELMHGISRETLDQYGRDAVGVATMFNDLLAGEVVYSDAWGNDSSWLGLLYDTANLPQRFRLESLRTLLSDAQLEIWHETKEQVIVEWGFERHRASNDALILQQTYYQTAAILGQQQAC
ncbi:MAG TPA: hypothetical protein ENI05_09835 [Porticoccus sp.]|nr:hypothetical protein [Porticoccus sp.]